MAEEKRELCPNLTSSDDLINRIGFLSVDILNKEKVLTGLWKSVDELTEKSITMSAEFDSLKVINKQQLDNLDNRDKRIEQFKVELKSLEDILRKDIHERDQKIHQQEKTLKSIEGEAVINQEEVRKELISTRNELSALKESLKPPRKVKKKKINAKPARA